LNEDIHGVFKSYNEWLKNEASKAQPDIYFKRSNNY